LDRRCSRRCERPIAGGACTRRDLARSTGDLPDRHGRRRRFGFLCRRGHPSSNSCRCRSVDWRRVGDVRRRACDCGAAAAALGVVCFAVVVALAAKAPGAAFSACIALLVLIPVYAAPTVHALPLYPPLILMWALVIAVAACRAQSAGRVTALDVAVVAMFVMMAASTLVTHAPLREIVFPAFVWLGPYMAGRVVASRFGGAVIATRLAQGGVALAPLAIYESFTRHNLFAQLGQPSGAYDVWLQQATRGGVNRVATSFGHPLALGMFLSTAAVFAAWRAVASETRNGRLAWIA